MNPRTPDLLAKLELLADCLQPNPRPIKLPHWTDACESDPPGPDPDEQRDLRDGR